MVDSKELIHSLNESTGLKLDCTPGTFKIVGVVEIDGTGWRLLLRGSGSNRGRQIITKCINKR